MAKSRFTVVIPPNKDKAYIYYSCDYKAGNLKNLVATAYPDVETFLSPSHMVYACDIYDLCGCVSCARWYLSQCQTAPPAFLTKYFNNFVYE